MEVTLVRREYTSWLEIPLYLLQSALWKELCLISKEGFSGLRLNHPCGSNTELCHTKEKYPGYRRNIPGYISIHTSMFTVLSELDDSLSGMSGTQVSQWVREKLPPGRTSDRSNGPKNDAEML